MSTERARPGAGAANARMRRYWNEVAGPRWIAMQGAQEARNREVAELLLAAAAPRPGERVLDIGCGTGATALPLAEAVGPSGHVTGIDISEPMLAEARRHIAARGLQNVALLLADAQTHPLPATSFDLLTSRFGVMFFEDPVAAFRNLRDAARPGGRLCLAVWASIADNVHWRIPYEIAVRHLGPPAPQPPHAPSPMVFADTGYLHDVLAAAGFADIAIDRRAFHVVGDTASEEAERAGLLGPAARLIEEKQASEEVCREIVAETEAAFTAFVSQSGLRLPGTVFVATARRST